MEMQVDQTQDLENNQASSDEVTQAANLAATPPAQTVTPAAEPSGLEKLKQKSGNVAPPAVKADDAAAAAVVEAYKANLKFKAAGKEHEVPELLRGVMKDADAEKYVHSLLSKAHGLEMVQGKLKETREQREQIHQAYSKVMEPIQYAREAYGRNDLDTVFDTLKIDPNKILQWAHQKVQLSQMPPDQRQVYEARTQAEKRAFELERQTASLSQQNLQQQSEQISQMLDIVLERPDFGAVAQAYDTRRGKPGAFRDLVSQMGEQEYARSGKVISPVDAAKAAVELLGEKLNAPAQPAAAPVIPQAQPAAVTETPKQKITLPNVTGAKAVSPAKSPVKSLDDIRKLHQKMASATK